MSSVVVHYHELALKGRNRGRFERRLRQNLARTLGAVGECRVRSLPGRILIETEGDAGPVVEAATRVCGVAAVSPVERLPRDLKAAGAAVIARFEARRPATFCVRARRVDKRFPMISPDIEREVGAQVYEATGVPVDLTRPAVEAALTVMEDEILLTTERHPGPGGLPVGTGGRVAVLMSGGIDSPVAAWRMLRRGCTADLVHFHSHPLVDRTTQEKAHDLAELLTRWQYRTRLHQVPLAQIQTEVRLHTPEPLRVILYRRFMMRITEVIARRRHCEALVTGESLGQVSSQTLSNIATIEQAATLPVLRPLVGRDKEEIISEARRVGTYETSIEPDQDCCTLFVPRNPATHSKIADAESAELALDVQALVEQGLSNVERLDFSWPEKTGAA